MIRESFRAAAPVLFVSQLVLLTPVVLRSSAGGVSA